MEIFFANVDANEAHNKREDKTYTRSTSAHSDMTLEEKKKYRLGLRSPLRARSFVPVAVFDFENIPIPDKGKNLRFEE